MNPALRKLLRLAYSAERAAAIAYQGHAASTRNAHDKTVIKSIEMDEWHHRKQLKVIMDDLGVRPSKWRELLFLVIGKLISWSCHVLGGFIPAYFAGRLESGGVNEYLEMKRLLSAEGITKHNRCIEEMARVEKDHEIFFAQLVSDCRSLSLFQWLFRWGPGRSFNSLTHGTKDQAA